MRAGFRSFVRATGPPRTAQCNTRPPYMANSISPVACLCYPKNHPAVEKTTGFPRFGQANQLTPRAQQSYDRRRVGEGRDEVTGTHFDAVLEPLEGGSVSQR